MPRIFVSATDAGAPTLEALRPRAVQQFRHLPVLVLEVTAEEARKLAAERRLRVHVARFGSYAKVLETLDETSEGVPWGSVVNLSNSPGPARFDPLEPVNQATLIVAQNGVVPVLAAGNDGPAEGTMSSWAQAPWVVAVGAAAEDGSELLPFSSIGRPGPRQAGPLVVAHGRTEVGLTWNPRTNHATMVSLLAIGAEVRSRQHADYTRFATEGTSVAAPRVTAICLLLVVLLRIIKQLYRAFRSRLSDEPRLSDLLLAWEALVAAESIDAPGLSEVHGLPRDAVLPLVRTLRSCTLGGLYEIANLWPRATNRPEPVSTIRAMLAAMARPMPAYERHQVGAGFVDETVAQHWLAQLQPAGLVRLLHGTLPRNVAVLLDREEPVLPASLLAILNARREKTRLVDAPVI